MFEDILIKTIIFIVSIVLIIFVFGAGYAVYDNLTADSFSLRKDSWTCSKSHNETTFSTSQIGKVSVVTPITSTVCDQWSRK